jgi:hypothetical protein
MTPIERFWLDLIDGRKHHIQTLYGTDAMQRYRPHPMEREYFINNNGQRYENKILANKKKYEATGSYKALKREREELVSYIRGITVRDAQREETNTQATKNEAR